jgi:hypothetical protein
VTSNRIAEGNQPVESLWRSISRQVPDFEFLTGFWINEDIPAEFLSAAVVSLVALPIPGMP